MGVYRQVDKICENFSLPNCWFYTALEKDDTGRGDEYNMVEMVIKNLQDGLDRAVMTNLRSYIYQGCSVRKFTDSHFCVLLSCNGT